MAVFEGFPAVTHASNQVQPPSEGFPPWILARLCDAAYRGDIDTVESLARLHTPLDACNAEGWAPLHLASMGGHVQATSVLLAHGAGVDVHSRTPRSLEGCTPLHLAAVGGHARIVSLLLAAGATVDARDDSGYTPLHVAAELGHYDVVKRLLLAGARHDILVGDDTALSLALRHRRADVVGLLRQIGAKRL